LQLETLIYLKPMVIILALTIIFEFQVVYFNFNLSGTFNCRRKVRIIVADHMVCSQKMSWICERVGL